VVIRVNISNLIIRKNISNLNTSLLIKEKHSPQQQSSVQQSDILEKTTLRLNMEPLYKTKTKIGGKY